MPAPETRTTKQLFRHWRAGDADAGGAMAQRFADWYFAVATTHLGESAGGSACRESCRRFEKGIISITDAARLIPWAHAIVREEIDKQGGRVEDADEPGAYTNRRAPKELLLDARAAIPDAVASLEALYSDKQRPADPVAALTHRHTVKQWLRDHAQVPFRQAPEVPDLDRAPLPLYESGSLGSSREEAELEAWMLTDVDICQDVAEFAPFAIALRGGLPADDARLAPAPPTDEPAPVPQGDQVPATDAPAPVEPAAGGGSRVTGAILAFVFGAAIVALLMWANQ